MYNRDRTMVRALAVIACSMLVSPDGALAKSLGRDASAGPGGAVNTIVDVALRDGGVLIGQVYNAEGAVRAGVPLVIRDRAGRDVQVKTDALGVFAVNDLRGGVYQIRVGTTVAVYRLWAPGTAPPAARSGAVLVESQQVSRGQGKGRPSVFQHPWALTAVVAAAIVVPIAITNESSGS